MTNNANSSKKRIKNKFEYIKKQKKSQTFFLIFIFFISFSISKKFLRFILNKVVLYVKTPK